MTEYLNPPEIHRLTGYVLGPDAKTHKRGEYPGGGIENQQRLYQRGSDFGHASIINLLSAAWP